MELSRSAARITGNEPFAAITHGVTSSVPFRRQSSIIPQLMGTDQVTSYCETRPIKANPRRISMHDAANDVMQTTYPPLPASTTHVSRTPGRHTRDKGKGKAREQSGPRSDQPALVVNMKQEPGVRYVEGLGTICVACGRSYPRPGLHRQLLDGSGCVDVQPLRRTEWQQPTPSNVQPVETRRPKPAAVGPVGPSGSVDMGLRTLNTNDSFITAESVQSDMAQQMLLGQEHAVSIMHRANLVEQLTWAEQCARKFSESGGLFF